ncbi:peptidase inhibitor family I36 protein [Kitasatospora brasiliensis]|uniref:peptidase inhibitor family I36 protein n=1 Tax=Kitasatospora brasiliensis TaxID=3058040 RepID=UPI00292FD06D|nr:peptidase inhibitor family I36 protein [Kitasatospora sp. K002]
MKLRSIATGAGAAVLLLGWSIPAQAAGSPNPGVTSRVSTPEEEARHQEGLAKSTGEVTVLYHGQHVKISSAWAQGAQNCTEFGAGDNRCFDTAAEADRATAEFDAARPKPLAPQGASAAQTAPSLVNDSSCLSGWVCIYADINFEGRKLQWSSAGQKNLDEWSFRDQASSACNVKNQGGFTLYDERDFMPDPGLIIGLKTCSPDFTQIGYQYGGNWNDKADYIVV